LYALFDIKLIFPAMQFWNKMLDYKEIITFLDKQKIRAEKKSKDVALNSESDEDDSVVHKTKEKAEEA